MRHNIVYEHGKATSATVFHRGRIYVAAKDHKNFTAIVDALEQGLSADEIVDLFDSESAIARGLRAARRIIREFAREFMEAYPEGEKLGKVASNVEIRGGTVTYEGEPVHGAVADAIARYHTEGNSNYVPLIRFLAKVMDNPSEHSRAHLYNWMKNKSFAIHEDGDLIAYKGVGVRRDSAGRKIGYQSTYSSGAATVNGKLKVGAIPQRKNDIVSMPRDKVTFDPRQACSTGLHVGTYGYATNFGSVIIEVKINPVDVVSVPNDANQQKMRVCRYQVMGEVTAEAVKLLRSEEAQKVLT